MNGVSTFNTFRLLSKIFSISVLYFPWGKEELLWMLCGGAHIGLHIPEKITEFIALVLILAS